LAASGQIDAGKLAGYEFAGELSLSGELRPVRGALAMSLVLRQQQVRTRLVLPPGSAEEAALVPDAEVFRARHLLDVVQQFLPPSNEAPPEPGDGWARMASSTPNAPPLYADLADVKGQAGVKRVLEIAAAGGHSLLMVCYSRPSEFVFSLRFRPCPSPTLTSASARMLRRAMTRFGGRPLLRISTSRRTLS
jgi:magnesium chelatase family protein